MQRFSQWAALACLLLTLPACATIVRGSNQKIQANSAPAGATILVNGENRGTTPTTLLLPRNRSYQVVFRHEGYDDVTVNLNQQFEAGAALVGNIFSWGLLGMVVDVANGSAYQLTPDQLNVALEATDRTAAVTTNPDAIQVVFFTPDEVADIVTP